MTEIKVTVGSTKIVASVVQGMNGKTAYQSAVSGGYTGTEGQFYLDLAKVDGFDSRLNSIITTPADSVSAQEIIDARDGELSLGAKIQSIDTQASLLAPKDNPTFTGVVTASQIKFPATQVPSANPNTLDDYEEGTFSVTLKNNLNEEFTISDQICYYTKIGNVVTVNLTITTSNKPTSGSFIRCGGLPFSSKRYTAGSIGYASGTTDSSVSNLTLETSGFVFYLVYKNTGATGYSLLAPSQVSNTFKMEAISITYLTD